MTLRTRLKALERNEGPRKSDHDNLMADLIGTIDGLFWPDALELSQLESMPTVKNQRELYHEAGIAWAGLSDGRDAAAWKTNQRQREALEKSGLVTFLSTGATPLLKPTAAAMTDWRQRLGLYHAGSVEVLKLKMRCAIALVNEGSLREEPDAHPWAPGELAWCHETWLFDRTYKELPTRNDWARYAEIALPLLIEGSLETKQTTLKHVCYRLTPKPDDIKPVEPIKEKHVEEMLGTIERLSAAEEAAPARSVNEDVEDVYFSAFHRQLAKNEQHKRTDEIFIPLPATSIGVIANENLRG